MKKKTTVKEFESWYRAYRSHYPFIISDGKWKRKVADIQATVIKRFDVRSEMLLIIFTDDYRIRRGFNELLEFEMVTE